MKTLGADIGRVNDATVASITLQLALRGPIYVTHSEALPGTGPQMASEIAKRAAFCDINIVEVNGMGHIMADLIEEKLKKHIIRVTTGSGDYFSVEKHGFWSVGTEFLFLNLLSLWSEGLLIVPENCRGAEHLKSELNRFQVLFTRRKRLRFEAKSGHDDRVFALAHSVLPYRGISSHGKSKGLGQGLRDPHA